MRINLPQVIVSSDIPSEGYLTIIAGGRAPESNWLKSAAHGSSVWVADHGIDICKSACITPARIIGDGDSASGAAWKWGHGLGVPMEEYPAKKDYTDTQIALIRAKELAPNYQVLLTGAFGGRFDHAFSTIFSFASSGLNGCISDDKESCFFLNDGESLSFDIIQKPLAISLLPMTKECTGVTSAGLYWPLTDAILHQSYPDAVSNVPVEDSIHISIDKGTLAVYFVWDES